MSSNTVPLIVNHVSDPNKQNGLLVSTYSYLGSFKDENGVDQVALVNVHNVVWPSIPTPLYHQEADTDLEFVSVYDIHGDEVEEEGEEEEEEKAEESDNEEVEASSIESSPTEDVTQ